MEYQLYATCPNELTDLLAREIVSIGGRDVRTDYRVVYFSASKEIAYKAHLSLRMASRICRILKEIPAQSPRIIFDKARKIRFHELFDATLPVAINVFAANDGGKISNDLIGSKLREAINDCFKYYLKKTPNRSSWNAPIGITGYYNHRRLLVSVDTSFESLHRRGFRVEGHPAPLKETLAAALLTVCEYDGTMPFYDPMCGSGTIAIEAAQIAINRAPLIHRQKGGFGLEYLHDFDPRLWQKIRKQLMADERNSKVRIFASDIQSQYVDISRQTVKNAKLVNMISIEKKDFFKTEKPAEHGLLIANIPYGLRLNDTQISKEYLRALGDKLKNSYKGWRCGILAPVSAPLKEVGLKPLRQVPFLNGTVPVKLLVFDIY
ncbi:hypothetical protein KAR48_14495 [bacterium]|nr:hypothetical protein [bacterium]